MPSPNNVREMRFTDGAKKKREIWRPFPQKTKGARRHLARATQRVECPASPRNHHSSEPVPGCTSFHAAVEIDAARRRLARALIRLHRPQLAEGVAKQRHRDRQRCGSPPMNRALSRSGLLIERNACGQGEGERARKDRDRGRGRRGCLRCVEAKCDHMRLGQVRGPRARVRDKVLQPHPTRFAVAVSHGAAVRQHPAALVAVALQSSLVGARARARLGVHDACEP